MVNKILLKETYNSIKKNIKKYLSLVCIIVLGVGFYVGMNSTTPVMKSTISSFYNRNNFMDLQVISDIGLTQNELNEIKDNISQISLIEGGYRKDVITKMPNSEVVISVLSYSKKNAINSLDLIDGYLPTSIHECVVEEAIIENGYKIGDTIYLNSGEFKDSDVTITGVVQSPLYISNDRGNTSLLSGKVGYYIYVDEENFMPENYTFGYIKINTKGRAFSDKYTKEIEKVLEKVETVSQTVLEKRLGNVINENSVKLSEMELNYKNAEAEAIFQLDEAHTQITYYENKLNEAYASLKTEEEIKAYILEAETKLNGYKVQLDEAKNQLDELKNAYDKIIDSSTITALQQNLSYYEQRLLTLQKELQSYEKSLKDNQNNYNNTYSYFQKRMYSSLISFYENNIKTVNTYITECQNKINEIKKQINDATGAYPAYIMEAEKKYNDLNNQYQDGLNQLNYAKTSMLSDMQKAKTSLDYQKADLEAKKNELKAEEQRYTEKFENEQLKIDNFRDQIDQLRKASWHTYTRNNNTGYSHYLSDIDTITNLCSIFPIVFFLVAGLITLTSLSRMVEQERTQIGTFIALGYTNRQVMLKYLIYTLSAVIIGSIIGIILGSLIIPLVIYEVYNLIYTLPDIKLQFNIIYIFLGMFFALISTIFTSYFVIKSVVDEVPCKLMKPKNSKIGKRLLIEYIPFIWKKTKFIDKVTIRNIFRYKKRLFMTLAGVSGCTALILVGFGLRSSISKIIPIQYGDIFTLDVQLFYKDDVSRETIIEEQKRIVALENVQDAVSMRMETIDIEKNDKVFNITMLASQNNAEFDKVINLIDANSKKKIVLDNNGVIITKKLADLLNVKVGDKIKFNDMFGDTYSVVITNVCEHYLDHYIYMTSDYYYSMKNNIPRNNMLIVKSNKISNEEEFAKNLNANNYFSSMSFMSSAKEVYKDVTKNLNSVVIVVIISAGLLAFIVLYNLSALNISERRRELATLKVLGFRQNEVRDYIKKEIIWLTIIGIILGLVIGYYLTNVVIISCEIDNMMFVHKQYFINYLYAIIITSVFSLFVNFSTNRELEKVDMVESLKSLE